MQAEVAHGRVVVGRCDVEQRVGLGVGHVRQWHHAHVAVAARDQPDHCQINFVEGQCGITGSTLIVLIAARQTNHPSVPIIGVARNRFMFQVRRVEGSIVHVLRHNREIRSPLGGIALRGLLRDVQCQLLVRAATRQQRACLVGGEVADALRLDARGHPARLRQAYDEVVPGEGLCHANTTNRSTTMRERTSEDIFHAGGAAMILQPTAKPSPTRIGCASRAHLAVWSQRIMMPWQLG
mmetsp:Transcript_116206/g.369814  ORF Transcript_116206/g.369814 Transcript_116206/m.369814 type:complete len:238 (+) Transcript_116206:552-1265(+)